MPGLLSAVVFFSDMTNPIIEIPGVEVLMSEWRLTLHWYVWQLHTRPFYSSKIGKPQGFSWGMLTNYLDNLVFAQLSLSTTTHFFSLLSFVLPFTASTSLTYDNHWLLQHHSPSQVISLSPFQQRSCNRPGILRTELLFVVYPSLSFSLSPPLPLRPFQLYFIP